MSLLKFAYVRGAQNALVSSGAIEPYASELKADLAVKLAATAIQDDTAEDVPDEEMAQALAAMASNAEEELSAEDAKKLLEAAEEGSEELEDLMKDEMSEEEAREVVAYLKSAAAGQINSEANHLMKNVPNFQSETGARANDAAYHLNGAQGLVDPKKNAPPFTGANKPLHEGVSLDAKTAAAILRKLSEDGIPSDASAIGGANEDEQNDGRPENYANNPSQGNAKGNSNARPFTGDMTAHTDNVSASKLDLPTGSGSADNETKSAAYNFLLYKTAEEVGAFLPPALNETDKLAALRAMIGMTQPERAQYIQRIKMAMEESEKEDKKEDKSKEDKYLTEEQKKLPPEIKKSIIAKEEAKETQEKEAAYILNQLGLGR